MSTFRNPVGPQPTTVYWRRRLLVGLGIVAVIVVILLIVFAPRGTPAANTTTPPASSAPVDDEAGDVAACSKDQLTVEAATDRATYTAEQLPQLSAKITNSGSAPCEISSGADALVYTITSGDETIWTSTDCQSDPEAETTVLAAGEETQLAASEWNRSRSSTKTCDDENPSPVTAEGASYHVTVSVDGETSEKTRQIILN